MTVTILPLSPDTTAAEAEALLAPFLLQCVNWSLDRPALSAEALSADEDLMAYVSDWGRPGDICVLAVPAAPEESPPVGAAWVRLHHGYGWVADEVPELSVAVHPDHQGTGLGRALITALCSLVRMSGRQAVSLSVEDGNGSVHLYDQLGFRTVGRNGNSDVMLKQLS